MVGFKGLIIILSLLYIIHTAASLPCRGYGQSWPEQYLPAAAGNSTAGSNSTGLFCVQLTDNITLQYAIAGNTVLFDLQAVFPKDTAYFGLGFSELGSMKGADMAIFNNSKPSNSQAAGANGAAKSGPSDFRLVDSYAAGFIRPVADKQQDLRLVSSSYAVRADDCSLNATWVRPIVPCDEDQDLPLAVGMPVHLIWAHGSSWGYHGPNRGGKLVKFAVNETGGSGSTDLANASHATDMLSSDSSSSVGGRSGRSQPVLLMSAEGANATAAPDSSGSRAQNASGDVRVLDLVFPVEIPPQETTYRVMYFQLPDDRKYHVLKYEPVVKHPMLHHGVAYSCLPSDEPKVEALPNLGPYDRLKQGMLCEQFFMMLASNMTPWDAPPVAALPFGANSTRYVALELHYNNPEGVEGQNDTGSGIRVYYTPKLREHDVGVITLGQMVLDIPPGVERYAVNASICPGGCTSRFKQPLQLLSGFFHMHDLGKEISTRHYRNGRELTPLGHLRSFDYAYQSTQDIYAPDAKVLLPGDSLSLQCIFDSTSRVNVTKSGPGTRDEMCFYWISYWPAQEDMGYCLSLGGTQVAACGADVKTETTFKAFRDPALFANLTAAGTLLRFPGDPATNSTPYVQQCTNTTS